MKLHLGCGKRHIPGYVNIDFYRTEATDRILNIVQIDKSYKNETADVIYMSHVLEHFERTQGKELLVKLFNILKPGGIIRLAVPDWDAIIDRYNETKNLEEIITLVYGRHDIALEGHYTTWTFDSLKQDLMNTGFTKVWKYPWQYTEHASIDDFGRAHLPHDPEAIKAGNFYNHKLMSLNIEAIK